MAQRPFVMVVTGLAFEARIAGRGGLHNVYCGHGAVLKAALDGAGEGDCRGLISFGIAAGLDPTLGPGTIVVASQVLHEGRTFAADEAWRAALGAKLPNALSGSLVGRDDPVLSVQDKRLAFGHTGAAALDMESHVAAAFAAERGLPFAALRVVADSAGQVVPRAAMAAMRDDGTTDVGSVLRALVRRPIDLAALAAVAIGTWRARRALVRAGRVLGPDFGLPDFG